MSSERGGTDPNLFSESADYPVHKRLLPYTCLWSGDIVLAPLQAARRLFYPYYYVVVGSDGRHICDRCVCHTCGPLSSTIVLVDASHSFSSIVRRLPAQGQLPVVGVL